MDIESVSFVSEREQSAPTMEPAGRRGTRRRARQLSSSGSESDGELTEVDTAAPAHSRRTAAGKTPPKVLP